MTNQEFLQQVVIDCEPLLQEIWTKRKSDNDIIVLAEVTRKECLDHIREWWKPEFVDKYVGQASNGRRAFLPCLQPFKLLDAMDKSVSFAQKAAAKELRGFAAMSNMGCVPLWVVSKDGHWPTTWSASEKVMVVRRGTHPRPGKTTS
jgi:hypothetical protein